MSKHFFLLSSVMLGHVCGIKLAKSHAKPPGLPWRRKCWDTGENKTARDEACHQDLGCAQKGYDERDFGDCDGYHCCSVVGWISEFERTFIQPEIKTNFASKQNLPREQFEERLRGILNRGKDDPANAQFISNGFAWSGGFTSRANLFINEVAMAMYFNRSISFCNCTFVYTTTSKFYDLPVAVYNDPSRVEGWKTLANDDSEHCPLQQLKLGKSVFATNFLQKDFQYISGLKRFLHSSIFKLKPEVKTKIATRLDLLGFRQDIKYIGVHIRHGDKSYEAAALPFELYAAEVRKALDLPGMQRSVYVASDDKTAADEMTKLLPDDVHVFQQFDAASTTRVYNSDDSFFALLLDIEALKSSEVFIGTHSSNVGSFVFHGRPAYKKTISLDVKWEEVPRISSDTMW